jgi:hypothetical protein
MNIFFPVQGMRSKLTPVMMKAKFCDWMPDIDDETDYGRIAAATYRVEILHSSIYIQFQWGVRKCSL